jgi:hypothetical protein
MLLFLPNTPNCLILQAPQTEGGHMMVYFLTALFYMG